MAAVTTKEKSVLSVNGAEDKQQQAKRDLIEEDSDNTGSDSESDEFHYPDDFFDPVDPIIGRPPLIVRRFTLRPDPVYGLDHSSEEEEHETGMKSYQQQCVQLLTTCSFALTPYFMDYKKLLHQPIGHKCQNAETIRNCIITSLESMSCMRTFAVDNEMTRQSSKTLQVLNDIYTYVCEEHLDEIENYAECFRDVNFNVEECSKERFESIAYCDPNVYIECTDAAIDNTPTCAQVPEAKERLADVIRITFNHFEECQVPGMKLLKKLFK